jgi:hypothetical protein
MIRTRDWGWDRRALSRLARMAGCGSIHCCDLDAQNVRFPKLDLPSITHASTSEASICREEAISEYDSCLLEERAARVARAMSRSLRVTVSAVS